MSMGRVKHMVNFPEDFPRSGLIADGPDWDRGVDCSVEPSRTKQSFKDECDINTIMSRYAETGVMPNNPGGPMYQFGDAISEYSYQESLNAVIAAEADFASLPARVRERFGNDPAKLFAFLDDPANRDEAVKLGLVEAPVPEPAPTKVEVVNPPQQTEPAKAG